MFYRCTHVLCTIQVRHRKRQGKVLEIKARELSSPIDPKVGTANMTLGELVHNVTRLGDVPHYPFVAGCRYPRTREPLKK